MKINCKEETKRIVKFIKQTFENKGFERAVIGLSGGIDSAVVCALLKRTLGANNVCGYSLPYGKQKDILDAKYTATKYKVNYETVNIKDVVDTLLDATFYPANISKKKETLVSIGNIKARVRMICLYDFSVVDNALVVGTGNKTEIMLGYFTQFGDGACALEPIGHLYKTQVKQLAKYLEVPKTIINKSPSAGLWEGQTDEEEIGVTYKEIDEILTVLYRGDNPIPAELEHSHFTSRAIGIVSDLVNKNKFKSQPPNMIKE